MVFAEKRGKVLGDGQRKSVLIILLVVFTVLLVSGGIYFYIDNQAVSSEIEAIDSARYSDAVYEKGAQDEAKGVPLVLGNIEELKDNIYHTPMGFSIISYSEKWTGEKLVDIYNELLNNEHGEEMLYVAEVVIYPGASSIDQKEYIVAGTQSSKEENYLVFLDIPAVIPESLKYSINPTVSVIELYNMDTFDSVQEAARTIAHEYGHHYTIHYFMQNDDAVLDSEYYRIRNIVDIDHEVFYSDAQSYYDNHAWDIYEIAAEDYVQLMGSPNAKIKKEYYDNYDLLRAGKDTYDLVFDDRAVNVFPQENIFIPLADEIEGLREYYYSFIGEDEEYESLPDVDFNIKIAKKSSNGYRYYNITWDKPISDKDAMYSLVCYDKNGNIYRPVKTISGDEKAIARVGTPSIVRGNYIYWWSDDIPKENRIFKVYLVLPDGRLQASEPFYVDF